jgi:hypothetical protein
VLFLQPKSRPSAPWIGLLTQPGSGSGPGERRPPGPLASASRVLNLPVHDPQVLVRIGPDYFEAGDPAGMLGRCVPFQIPHPDDSMPAVLDRAGPFQPRLRWVIASEQLGWTTAANGLTVGAHQHGEQALDCLERPGRGPAEGTVRPHSAPLLLEPLFDTIAGRASYPGDMTIREMLATLQQLPKDAEVLAFEAGCEEYCEREVDEVEWQGGRVYLHLERRSHLLQHSLLRFRHRLHRLLLLLNYRRHFLGKRLDLLGLRGTGAGC